MSKYSLRKRESTVKYVDESLEEPSRKRRPRRSLGDNELSDDDFDLKTQSDPSDDNYKIPKRTAKRTPKRAAKRSSKRGKTAKEKRHQNKESSAVTEPCASNDNEVIVEPQNQVQSTTNTEQEQENNDDQLEDVLHALLELHHLDESRVNTIEGSSQAITEALQVNRELQQEAKAQIAWINQRILQNEALMRKMRLLSMQEAKTQERRFEIHKKYPTKLDFFVDDRGNKPALASSTSSGAVNEDLELERKPWTNSERNRLFSAIHTEAQRALVLELVAQRKEHKIWDIDKLDHSVLENIEVNKLDWQRISSIYVKTRTPMQCIIQWTTQEHPKINKKPWSKAESTKLDQLVQAHGFEGQWEKIAAELNTNRTASQCFSHYQSEHNNSKTTKGWTKEEDESLRQAVEMLGEGNWQQVAVILGNRTGNQCLQRWSYGISPAIRRERWNEEEDRALKGAVDFYGVGHWNRIRRHLPGRTDMQCRERWMNVLDPSISREPLSKEDSARLVELVKEHGRKWSLITKFFPGRTDNFLLRAYRAATNPPKRLHKSLRKERVSTNTPSPSPSN